MNGNFRQLDMFETARLLEGRGHLFLGKWWEDKLKRAFPYLSFLHLLYKESFYIRLCALPGGKVTSAPFSDGGDVVSLSGEKLNTSELIQDIEEIKEFNFSFLRVNQEFCEVSGDIGYRLQDYRIDLEDGVKISSLRKTLRHSLRDYSDEAVTLAGREEEIGEFYRLYLRNMREVQNLALPKGFFMEVFKSGEHDIFLVKDGDRVESGAVFLNSPESSHYFVSASSEKKSNKNTSQFILWHAIQLYKQSKQAIYLGGTERGSSLSIFKEGWRGDPIAVYEVPSSDSITRSSKIRKLWRLAPLSLLPRASRVLGKYVF